MAGTDQDDAKLSVQRHSRERPHTVAYSQRFRCFIPVEWNDRVGALLVSVTVALVFIERKGAVCAAIDADFNRIARLLVCVFDFRAKRHDGSCANEERKRLKGSIHIKLLFALNRLSGPEIVPNPGIR